MSKYIKIYLTLCWLVFIFTIISHPFPEYANAVKEWTWYDKGIHLTLYFVLAFLIMESLKEFMKNFKLVLLITFVLCFLYATFNEYVQTFVPGRDSSVFDSVASLFGAGLAIVYGGVREHRFRPSLLLHVCCIGCGAYVSDLLKKDYKVTLFFYNPNIFPKEEYALRLEETKRIAKKFKLPLEIGVYTHKTWLKKVKGLEKEPERGGRCDICYLDRLEKTAKLARKKGFQYFASTLSVSPYKDAKKLSNIGQELEKKHKIKFLDKDFKKQDGFKKAAQLSRKLGLYRQNYCGCEFSVRPIGLVKGK